MKKFWLIIILGLAACGGKLSDEQRKRLREGMEDQKIVKLSDSEIVSAGLEQGQTIFAALQSIQFDTTKIDSLEKRYEVKIHYSVPGDSNSDQIQQQLIEAYIAGMATGSLQDNIQKLYKDDTQNAYDMLLYSKPVVSPMPDGVEKLDGVWHIYLSKKQIILKATSGK
jgi:uncharacterized membrane protein